MEGSTLFLPLGSWVVVSFHNDEHRYLSLLSPSYTFSSLAVAGTTHAPSSPFRNHPPSHSHSCRPSLAQYEKQMKLNSPKNILSIAHAHHLVPCVVTSGRTSHLLLFILFLHFGLIAISLGFYLGTCSFSLTPCILVILLHVLTYADDLFFSWIIFAKWQLNHR